MANKNKTFLTEEERGVLTPKSTGFPREAKERFFEVEGNIKVLYSSSASAKKITRK